MKYFVFEDEFNPPTPVIFPVWLVHDIVARQLDVKDKITSAGFVTMFDGKIDCYGTSTSLRKKASDLFSRISML